MNDFERESSTMDMKEEMMSDAVDDAMEDEDEGEGEEAEGDKILKEVLDEIGMGMNDAVSLTSRDESRSRSKGRASWRRWELMSAHIRTDVKPYWAGSSPCFTCSRRRRSTVYAK
jgi:charged multivesicular body protein 2A